jgi:hypothetical protein
MAGREGQRSRFWQRAEKFGDEREWPTLLGYFSRLALIDWLLLAAAALAGGLLL